MSAKLDVKPTDLSTLNEKDLQTLRPIFNQFDASGDGYVSLAELGKIIGLMKLEMSPCAEPRQMKPSSALTVR